MTSLEDAVDELTLPKPVKVPIDGGFTWATEDPLLDQLAQAVASGLGSPSGGAAEPWARNLLNTDALYMAGIITSQIGDWCRMVGAPTTRDAAVDLRSWHTWFTKAPGESLDAGYIRKLGEWAVQIREMLNPPRVLEITRACTECLEAFYVNTEGNPVPWPLVLSYRANTGDMLDNATVKCRACGGEWKGEWALRGLRHDIDEMDAHITKN